MERLLLHEAQDHHFQGAGEKIARLGGHDQFG
jgi:hypothetical protein